MDFALSDCGGGGGCNIQSLNFRPNVLQIFHGRLSVFCRQNNLIVDYTLSDDQVVVLTVRWLSTA